MIFEKLKQVFKGKNDENIAENMIEDNKNALNESTIVYPENIEDIKENSENSKDNVNTESTTDNQEDNMFNLLDAKDNDSLSEEATDNSITQDSEKNVDYDKEIKELLKMDSETLVEDVDYEYINDISVYDTIRNDKENVFNQLENETNDSGDTAEDDENGSESQNGINKMYVALIGVISLLIIISMTFVFVFASVSASKVKKANASLNKKVIQPSAYKANKANYIYVSQMKDFNNQIFSLSKILVDSQATLFYFDNKFDVQKYNIMLVDNNGVSYGMDLSFIQNMESSQNEEKETVLRFEPLNLNAKGITLSLYDTDAGKKIDFKFDFSTNIEKSPVKYIFDKQAVSSNSDVKISIDNAVFSSAGSTVNYTIKSSGGNFSIVQEKGEKNGTVVLEENASALKKLKKYPSMYTFDNGKTILGRMDFDSVKNLNSKVYFSFNNLYKSYTVNRDISAKTLNVPDQKQPISFDVGNYKVVLEGIGSFNDRIVLVLHGEDKNVKYDSKNPNANRVEVRLDAQLISSNSSGIEVILDGVSQSAEYGTDMCFLINDSNRDLIYNLGAGNLTVRVNSVLIKTDDAKFEFDLRKAETNNDSQKEKACNDVIDAFKGRLAYKSGQKSRESLIGFGEQIMKNNDILSEYTPQEITGKPEYSAQIISSAMEGDKFYAVVQEVWKGVNGIKETHFDRTHKIIAQKGDYFWTVIEDNIIK